MPTIANLPATIPEMAIARTLDKMGIFYEFQTAFMGGRYLKGGIVSDFYLPQYSLILSVLGAYWHSGSENMAKDILQAQAMMSQGINTVWIDEKDALINPRYYIEQAILGISHSKLSKG